MTPRHTRLLRAVRSRMAPAAKTALLRLGGDAAIRRLLPSRRVAILRYHAICGPEGYAYADPAICISPRAFEDHARYLAANYAVLPLGEVVGRLRLWRPLPRNAVAITFDDGYADNLDAARTLSRVGIPATFFITAGCLAGGEPFWPAELRALLPRVRHSMLSLQTGREELVIPLRDPGERQAALAGLTRVFKSHSIPVRESLRDQIRRAAGTAQVPACMLRWDDVAEMVRLGMTIGAHTLTHPNLPSAGLSAAAAEIVGSQQRLERELGQAVTLFSYPNGGAERYFTRDIQRAVASHFKAAASSRNGFAGPYSDLYALERIEVEERLEDLVFALEVERFAFAPGAARA